MHCAGRGQPFERSINFLSKSMRRTKTSTAPERNRKLRQHPGQPTAPAGQQRVSARGNGARVRRAHGPGAAVTCTVISVTSNSNGPLEPCVAIPSQLRLARRAANVRAPSRLNISLVRRLAGLPADRPTRWARPRLSEVDWRELAWPQLHCSHPSAPATMRAYF